jgi:putative membrane protein
MRIGMLHTIKGGLVATTIASLTALTLQVQAQQNYSGSSSGSASATQTGTTTSDRATTRFIKEAARANEMEINLAQAGAQKAENADLKSFCQTMQQDHTQANTELQPLAQKYGVNIEQTRSSEREANRFEKETTGAKLDQKLATEFLKDHQKTIAEFEKASNQVTESDVKQYIDKMLPKLREHFQHAETVARAVGVSESTISSYTRKTPGAVGGTADEQGIQQGAGSKSLQEQNAPSSTAKP